MDSRTTRTEKARPGKATVGGGRHDPNDTGKVHDEGRQAKAVESLQKPAVKKEAPEVVVDGLLAKSFYCILRYPMHLITPDMGTHEATRVYYYGPDQPIQTNEHKNGLFGPGRIQKVEWQCGLGLWVHTNRGTAFSPASDCQLTYTLED